MIKKPMFLFPQDKDDAKEKPYLTEYTGLESLQEPMISHYIDCMCNYTLKFNGKIMVMTSFVDDEGLLNGSKPNFYGKLILNLLLYLHFMTNENKSSFKGKDAPDIFNTIKKDKEYFRKVLEQCVTGTGIQSPFGAVCLVSSKQNKYYEIENDCLSNEEIELIENILKEVEPYTENLIKLFDKTFKKQI